MARKKKGRAAHDAIERLCFPEAERIHDWLSMLLDAYHLTNKGVAAGIRLMEKKGFRLACAKGCHFCCLTHRSIPTYPLELVGITWYATEVLMDERRAALKLQLRDHKEGDPCAFLINGACAIHPMRPMACRLFNVFNSPCKKGEDAFYTRRHEVLTPIKKFTDDAFIIMMPFYGVKKRSEARKVVQKELMHTMAKDMQVCNWVSLADKMDAFDRKK